jgi:hypothetical protein
LAYDARPHIDETKRQFETPSFSIVSSLQKYCLLSDRGILERDYTCCHISQFASVICATGKMYFCCHTRNQHEFCIGDLRKQSFLDIVRDRRRYEIAASLDVRNCLELCRGDHVNRQVERLANGEDDLAPRDRNPKHVNFL